MRPWEEQLVELRVAKEIGARQAKTDAEVVEQLVPAFYFAQEATQKLRDSLTGFNERDARKACIEGALIDVLRIALALCRTAEVSGLSSQIALANAFKLLTSNIDKPWKH
jgi:hypothetical protein